MQTRNHGFHSLFRLAAIALVWMLPVSAPAAGQRIQGDADRLVLGPAAAVPSRFDGASVSPAPYNPASVAGTPFAGSASVAVPFGLRELSVYRASMRVPVRGTVFSVSSGRLGFDRLVQHRISVGAARGRDEMSAGVEWTLDRFTTPDRPAAHDMSLKAGTLLGWSDSACAGVVSEWGPAGVAGARTVHVSAAASLRLDRRVFASIGAAQSTSRPAEFVYAVRVDAAPALSLTASFSNGSAGFGTVADLTHAGVRIRMAWLHTGPAGAVRMISASFESEPDGENGE